MFSYCRRLFRTYPNVFLLLGGIWGAASPLCLMFFIESHVWAQYNPPSAVSALLVGLRALPYCEEVVAVIFFLGCGIALTAAVRIIRPWVYPKAGTAG